MSRTSVFIPLVALFLAIAIAGFWPTYFGPLVSGHLDERWLLHLHAAVSMGWLGLVGVQAYLAATGRRAQHVALGRWGMPFGVLVVVVGVTFALTRFAERVTELGYAPLERALVAPLCDMFVFSMFLAGAWLTRHRPESHKRFILLATNTLVIAAVGRLPGLDGTTSIAFGDVLPFLLVWLSPLLLAIAYDLAKHRRIHPVYAFGLVVLVLLRYRQLLRESDLWPYVTRWLANWLT